MGEGLHRPPPHCRPDPAPPAADREIHTTGWDRWTAGASGTQTGTQAGTQGLKYTRMQLCRF
ncbi:hypothetical protein E2C01_102499 [Portunus trituberculatus]|uniref:Uncharacterized protein n=1 Tax=Portunus trituberculatus TaxID=210409 RepID=A0A5B7KPB6_PORTR|nr:hypothetical protein [Portunus trituberculatus]